MRWNVGTKIGVGFGLALAIFVIVGLVAYRATTELAESSEWRKHTYEVLAELAELNGLLREAESGQRSYLLTGDTDYLDMYRNASGATDGVLHKLRTLTADNPRQQERLNLLDKAFSDRMNVSQETVDLYRTKGLEPALEVVKSGKGKSLSEDVAKVIVAMENDENGLLEQRIVTADRSTANAKATLIYGTIAALLVAGLAGLLITRNIAGPLQRLTGISERIIVGDLSMTMSEEARSDEVGVLERAFARMTQSLRGMAGAAEQDRRRRPAHGGEATICPGRAGQRLRAHVGQPAPADYRHGRKRAVPRLGRERDRRLHLTARGRRQPVRRRGQRDYHHRGRDPPDRADGEPESEAGLRQCAQVRADLAGRA